jgi:triosephosphate isomerase (TIM)
MRKPYLGGNWKMFGSEAQALLLIEAVSESAPSDIDVTVFPSFVYLSLMKDALESSHVRLGAQNCANHEEGAYTGEVSPVMLKDIGCHCVLLGHSERRQLFAETDQLIAEKFKLAQSHDLQVIYCIGETAEEREQDQTETVLKAQLDALLAVASLDDLANTVIAYEPVWAIGTGKVATPEIAQDAHAFIRQAIYQHDADVSEAIRIIYGGSVKPQNAKDIFAMPDIDGGLIGGASLKAQDFATIADFLAQA